MKRGHDCEARSRSALVGLLVHAVSGSAGPDQLGHGVERHQGAQRFGALPRTSAADLVDAADMHRIGPALYQALRGHPAAPSTWLPPLKARRDDQLMRHLRILSELSTVGAILDGLGVDWAVVKGPVLAEELWPSIGMREYHDLDLLVDRHRLSDVLDALVEHGCQIMHRNWPLMLREMPAELNLRLPYGTVLDLHWDLVREPDLRRHFDLSSPALLPRSRRLALGSTVVPTLDPTDTLLHLAYHAAHSGGDRLMWIKDVQLAATVPDLDWDVVRRRAQAAGLTVALPAVLTRVDRVLGLPASVTARLPHSGGAWSRLAAWRDRRYPPPRLPGERRAGHLTYMSIRGSSVSSALAAVQASARHGAGVLGSRLSPRRAISTVNPLYLDHPDNHAYRSYLDLVQMAESP